MIDTESTRDRLVNYGRWARAGKAPAARCYSIEGRYRPERLTHDEEEDRRAVRPLPIDTRDALLVFRAINPALGRFPVRLHLALAAEFIFRLPPRNWQGYMRRHGHGGIATQDIEGLVALALHAARNSLARHDSVCYGAGELERIADTAARLGLFALVNQPPTID